MAKDETKLDMDLILDEEMKSDSPKSEESTPKRVYGWIRDLPSNQNNFLQVASYSAIKKFPKQKFLTNLPPVYNQGHLGSCTANALGTAFQFEQRTQNLKDFVPSRLFIYYNERKLEGTIPIDCGASISDGIKTMTENGVCPEVVWPYDIKKFAEKPTTLSYVLASTHQVLASRRVPLNVDGFKTMINMGYPVVFGFTVYKSFESPEVAKSGVMTLPGPDETLVGGHAVLCVGYDDTMTSEDGRTVGYLKIRNSWGSHWGKDGDFYMPYSYVTPNLVSDLWVITKNEEPLVRLNRQLSKCEESMINKATHFVLKYFNK